MLLDILENLYCEESFDKKVEASMKLGEIGAKARTVAFIVFSKNTELRRPVMYFDVFTHEDDVIYVVTDFRYNKEGDRRVIGSLDNAVKFFVKKTLLKSCSYWAFEDDKFKFEVNRFMDKM